MSSIVVSVPQSPPDITAAEVIEGAATALGWDPSGPESAQDFVAAHLEQELWLRYLQGRHGAVDAEVRSRLPEPAAVRRAARAPA